MSERAILAAEKAGHAAAMVENLCRAGLFDKAEVWRGELSAWITRRDALAESLGGSSLVLALNGAQHDKFIANRVELAGHNSRVERYKAYV